jgi:DEAD/DEAH box helicase domain-containing protein
MAPEPLPSEVGEFSGNLKFVIIDEIHTYRGVFGSHVANVLRRLRRIAKLYGSDPVFIACSATIANPGELAEMLTGLRFETVTGAGLLGQTPLPDGEPDIRHKPYTVAKAFRLFHVQASRR